MENRTNIGAEVVGYLGRNLLEGRLMMKRLLIIMVVGVSVSSTYASIERTINEGSGWANGTMPINRDYIAVAHDNANENTVWTLDTDGIIHRILIGTYGWNENSFEGLSNIDHYSALSANPTSSGNFIYMAKSTGGLHRIYINNGWRCNVIPLATGVYSEIVADRTDTNTVWMIDSAGGIEKTYISSGWRNIEVPSTGGKFYNAIDDDVHNGSNFIYVAPSTGGLQRITASGGWRSIDLLGPNTYSAIASDLIVANQIFMVGESGGLERTWVDSGWHNEVISADTYVDVAADPFAGSVVYATRADGGLERFNLDGGGSWVSTILPSSGSIFSGLTASPVVANSVFMTVAGLLAGDANGDGHVDLQDFGLLKDNFGTTSGATWAQGDFNGDGAVDLQDFGLLKDNFGTGTAVPEPATLSLLAICGLGILRRRKTD